MPNFSTYTKNFIQTFIRESRLKDIIDTIISESMDNDWGHLTIQKVIYIAKKVAQINPSLIFKLRNEAKIRAHNQNNHYIANWLELLAQSLYLVQVNNKWIPKTQQPATDFGNLNSSSLEFIPKPSSPINTKIDFQLTSELTQFHNKFTHQELQNLNQQFMQEEQEYLASQCANRQRRPNDDKSSIKVKDLPDFYSTKTDIAFKALVDEANNGTKVSARTLFQALELKEQIVSLRIQTATQGLANTIAYYFEQIEDILDRDTKAQHTIANDASTPKQIRTFLKTIDKLRSYNQDVIMYCDTDQDHMLNTNTIRFKTPWNFSKNLSTDIIFFMKENFKSLISLGLIKFSVKILQVQSPIKYKHVGDDAVTILRQDRRRQNQFTGRKPNNKQRQPKKPRRNNKKRRNNKRN